MYKQAAIRLENSAISSGRTAGVTRRKPRSFLATLVCVVATMSLVGVVQGEERVFDLDIPESNAADALNRFAEQTGTILLFPSDAVRDRTANSVNGRFTLVRGLELLLEDTGLSGGLSETRVIRIESVSDAGSGSATGSSANRGATSGSTHTNGGNTMLNGSGGKSRGFLSGALAGLIASIGSAEAQDVNEAGDSRRSTTAIEEIIVTAQKREERIQDVPLSISAIGEFELDRRGINDFYDYARLVPGLAFTDQGAGNASFFIRGVSSPTGNPTTQFYIDDMPQLTSNA
jgi:hypothetical protein